VARICILHVPFDSERRHFDTCTVLLTVPVFTEVKAWRSQICIGMGSVCQLFVMKGAHLTGARFSCPFTEEVKHLRHQMAYLSCGVYVEPDMISRVGQGGRRVVRVRFSQLASGASAVTLAPTSPRLTTARPASVATWLRLQFTRQALTLHPLIGYSFARSPAALSAPYPVQRPRRVQ